MQVITRITLILLSLGWFCTNAQLPFIRHFGTSDSEYGTALTLSNSSDVLLGQTISDNGKIYFGIVKTDLNGNLKWSRVYGNRDINIIKSVKKLASGFIVLGSSWDTGSNSMKIELMHLNSNGDLVWAKEYTSGNADMPSGLSVYNNQIYVTGITDYNFPGMYPKLLWFKTDINGNPLDSKMWSAPFGVSPFCMAMNTSGKTGIACQSNSFGTGSGTFTNVIALQLDASGNIEWSKSLGTQYDDEVSSIASDNSDWLITGRSYFMNSAWDMSLFRVGSSGNLIWGNFYNAGTGNGEVGRSVITGNSQYIIAGDAGTFDERNMNLTSISPTGDVVWSKEYPINVSFTNYPYEVVAISNESGYLFTGDLRPVTSFRDAALIRTDSAGNAACFTSPLSMSKLSETIEDLQVALTPETFTLTNSNRAWQEINLIITENKICAVPDADFSYEPDTTSCPDYCYSFTDESVNAISWEWSFANATPSTFSGQTPPLVCFDTTGTFRVTLIVGDGTITDTLINDIVITAYCDTVDSAIFIPNVITPDGDYRNDQFEIKNLPDNFKLIIYNRWGNEIFVTTDKNKMWPEKPATDKTTEGVYFYVLQILEPDHKQEFHGNFTVIKNEN